MNYKGKDYHCYVGTDENGVSFFVYDGKMLDEIKADMDAETWPAEMSMDCLESCVNRCLKGDKDDIESENLDKIKKAYKNALTNLHIADAIIHDISVSYDDNAYIDSALRKWYSERDDYYHEINKYKGIINKLEE